ncbi:glycosyltransferase [Ureibacillus suwonensis]|uniref:Glycosyltransferase n=1 Tax=Ureibacillus suwonensis TaxID=313007 RepID=A0ABW0R9X9_9BACL
MNGLYLVYGDIKGSLGVKKKVKAQVDALNSLGINCDLFKVQSFPNKYRKVLQRLPYGLTYKKWIDCEKIKDLDFLYIRKPIIDYQFIQDLKKIKKTKSNIKILLEIPTFPYDQELSRFVDYPLLIKERINRKKLIEYVDRIITFSDDDEIFNIKTIKTQNGININEIKLRKISTKDNVINLLAVASVQKWHGYDRLIKGIADYYKKNPKIEVHFYLVGDGKELPILKKLTENLNVSKYIHFEGFKSGNELDKFYNICHIGIGSLGLHRIGLTHASTLKNREYCAKGLPFIITAYDNDFPGNFKYVYKLPQNEQPINIESIIDFYKSIYNEKNFTLKMREYAENYLSWEAKMKPVACFLEEE